MDMEAGKTLTNEEVIRELLDLLKKNAMKEQANDVFEICSYVDGLEKKIDSMTEELTNMQNQIKEMQEDTLVNNAKKALSEARERLNTRCEQIKSQVLEVKAQVKSTAKSIVDEAKAKGRAALYRVSEFLEIKKRLLDIRENVIGAIKTTDKDIAKTALLAKGFREAGQTAANAFRTFADKPEVDYSQKEQKLDCQHFFRQIFLGYFSDIVQAFDTLRKNVCGDDYTSLHNPIVLSSVLPAYGMFHSIQILFL